jgi:hypothetical protein
MGQSASGKAALRWARTCAAADRREAFGDSVCDAAGNSGGGQRPNSAVRILL